MGTRSKHKHRRLPHRRNRQEAETAAELTVPRRTVSQQATERAVYSVVEGAHALGIAAVLLAAASWLIWPILLGATAAVTGYMAYRQGSRQLGAASIALSLISVAAHLLIIPLYFAYS